MDSSPFAPLTPHDASEIASHLLAAKMFSLASCIMLFYDMAITFSDEVEKIWKQRFTGATVLWFMNRYLSPLGYIVIIVSFHADWPKSICNSYVLFPEVLKVFTAFAIGVIFILRLYSIYGKSTVVLVAMSILLALQLGVKIWAFTDGAPVELPPGLKGCILTGRSDRIVFTWIAELVFDTIVFFATLTRALIIYRGARVTHSMDLGADGVSGNAGSHVNVRRHVLKPSPLFVVMMRDGIIYFLVIFAANVVTVTLFMVLPPDLKVINASFSTLITSLMVSRLILNLRSVAYRSRSTGAQGQQSVSTVLDTSVDLQSGDRDGDGTSKRKSSIWAERSEHGQGLDGSVVVGIVPESIIGNLGEPVNDWDHDEPPDYHTVGPMRSHEMDEFIPEENSSSDSSTSPSSPTRNNCIKKPRRVTPGRSASAVTPDRILVEITTRKDVHRDSFRQAGARSTSPPLSEQESIPRSREGPFRHSATNSANQSPSQGRSSAWVPPHEWRRPDFLEDDDEDGCMDPDAQSETMYPVTLKNDLRGLS